MTAMTLLIVDDDPVAALYAETVLRQEGYVVRTAPGGAEALLSIDFQAPDAVVTDLRMPGMNGLELLHQIALRWPGLPVILLTVDEDVATIVEAVQLGAVNYLVKPVAPHVLADAVCKALAERLRPPATGALAEIVGESRAIAEVRHQIELAARTDVHVLVTGETGTGKELVARAIHRSSILAQRPFIAHNCAATPRDLFDSQFFGHRRGAFTGAERDHVGLVEQADGGVLLLDELETLSPEHQAKLLRVLDDGEVRPVGSAESRRACVRFIAATNRDPWSMIREGCLRQDLYYRLRGIEIRIPPLRERREDIPLLAAHFLKDRVSLLPKARSALEAFSWPGNVRQLRNVLRRAEAAAGGGPIGVKHLRLSEEEGINTATGGAWSAPEAGTLRDIERQAIVRMLEVCCGNRTLAPHRLGIDRSTLRRKLSELGINAPSP
jgi:DNA-binding NtrC family response regulator